ncbi:hypothetical protein KNO15_07715 [Leifsonia shinshuensis]|uniref:hypothetical protein n=1 Tax=Leifsonia shinshuensis TaxID=150026 RepID=UPI001F512378|nr:hypothetical protein [Leifsonia shinshuensis]MCI0156581.1 hypothetical protein [Leifsonia shinshuensis]
MNKKLIVLPALLLCLALVGCVGTTPAPNPSFTTVSPAKPPPTATSAQDAMPAASGIVSSVWVDVYPGTTVKAKHGCRCTLPKSPSELFPVGTPVLLLKVTMTGKWIPSQGNQDFQDVTGTTLKGTQFDGRPEPAVLDTADGPAAAKAAGLPWLPTGLFHGQSTWTIPNEKSRSFAAAYYVPAGVDQLELTVNIPSEGKANILTVPLPASATAAANASGE